MIEAVDFIRIAKEKGFRFYTGVPCSYFKSLINSIIDEPDVQYVGAANEGDAVAIAAGTQLGGMLGVAMLQNSGLGNAVSPLTSLTHTFRIPLLLIVTWRGQPDGAPDEPQHSLMGAITPQLLNLMGISWDYFPSETADIAPVLGRALEHIKQDNVYALVMKKNAVAPYKLKGQLPVKPMLFLPEKTTAHQEARYMRGDFLSVIQKSILPEDVILATTGYTGRELYSIHDRENQLYQAGSMGCVSSLGLGLALAQKQRRVVVIDGDGAALMRLGAWATIGYERPDNLIHILLDNQQHESTGGQSTVSASIDFCAMAAACGYPKVLRVAGPGAMKEAIASAEGLTFIYTRTKAGVPEGLPRPAVKPYEVAKRLATFIASGIKEVIS